MARLAGRKRVSADVNDEVNILQLTIHGALVGYLAGFKNGRNVLSIADTFKSDPERLTFSLITHPKFPNTSAGEYSLGEWRCTFKELELFIPR